MRAKKYIQMSDDCTIIIGKHHKTLCCDCGLVHFWTLVKVGKDGFAWRVVRDNRATSQMRKNHKYDKK